MTRQTETMTREAAAALAATSTTDLLTKAYQVTHAMHAIAGVNEGEASNLRAARDLITAEVLRRTGGQ
jgi:hypothetical protein